MKVVVVGAAAGECVRGLNSGSGSGLGPPSLGLLPLLVDRVRVWWPRLGLEDFAGVVGFVDMRSLLNSRRSRAWRSGCGIREGKGRNSDAVEMKDMLVGRLG